MRSEENDLGIKVSIYLNTVPTESSQLHMICAMGYIIHLLNVYVHIYVLYCHSINHRLPTNICQHMEA